MLPILGSRRARAHRVGHDGLNWARKIVNARALYLGPGLNSSTICSVFAISVLGGAGRWRRAWWGHSVLGQLAGLGARPSDQCTSLAKCESATGKSGLMRLAARFGLPARMLIATRRSAPACWSAPAACPHTPLHVALADPAPPHGSIGVRGKHAAGRPRALRSCNQSKPAPGSCLRPGATCSCPARCSIG